MGWQKGAVGSCTLHGTEAREELAWLGLQPIPAWGHPVLDHPRTLDTTLLPFALTPRPFLG